MKIAAIVVTYNRKDLLLETLRGIYKQQRIPDFVYIIDNASDCDVKGALEREGYLGRESLRYVRLDYNTGGAGGFHEGIKLAYEEGYDWFWTMDDDVEPDDDALINSIRYVDISECINSTKIFTANDEVQYWEQYFDFTTGHLIDLKNASFKTGKKWCPVNVACFEGMLVSRRVIDLVGLPKKHYFIYHDDTVFGIIASFYTNVIYVRDSVFQKKIYGYGAITPFRAYHMIRNTLWMRRDVYATGLVGTPTLKSRILTVINLFSFSVLMLRGAFSLRMVSSVLRGWVAGFRWYSCG